MSHKRSNLLPPREIFMLISMSFGSCPEQWCGRAGSVKISHRLRAAANNCLPTGTFTLTFSQNCLFSSPRISYCSRCQRAEEQLVCKNPFIRDFCCFLPFASSAQGQVYLHGRFKVVVHVLSSSHSLAPHPWHCCISLKLYIHLVALTTETHIFHQILFQIYFWFQAKFQFSPGKWLQAGLISQEMSPVKNITEFKNKNLRNSFSYAMKKFEIDNHNCEF